MQLFSPINSNNHNNNNERVTRLSSRCERARRYLNFFMHARKNPAVHNYNNVHLCKSQLNWQIKCKTTN